MSEGQEFTPKGEADIRKQVVEEYGLDPNDEANKPFIEKAVKKELDWQNEKVKAVEKEKSFEQQKVETEKKLSKAIEQKAKWRDEAKKLATLEDEPTAEPKPTGEPAPKPEPAKNENNEDIDFLKKKVSDLENSQHRQRYQHLTAEEYATVLSIAGSADKFDETLNSNPIVKNYLETNKVNERISDATAAPSTRTSPVTSLTYDKVSLSNPEHVKWLKSDPERLKEYDEWLDKEGSKAFTT